MESLNLPAYEFRVEEHEGQRVIYDPLRQMYVQLTPEEWVRQHFAQYLIQDQGVPAGLVALEASLEVEGQPRRADLVAHTRQGDSVLLVECKAPRVTIDQAAFDQSAQYNLALGAPFLVVTNGLEHYACLIDVNAQTYKFLDRLPDYETMLQKTRE